MPIPTSAPPSCTAIRLRESTWAAVYPLLVNYPSPKDRASRFPEATCRRSCPSPVGVSSPRGSTEAYCPRTSGGPHLSFLQPSHPLAASLDVDGGVVVVLQGREVGHLHVASDTLFVRPPVVTPFG